MRSRLIILIALSSLECQPTKPPPIGDPVNEQTQALKPERAGVAQPRALFLADPTTAARQTAAQTLMQITASGEIAQVTFQSAEGEPVEISVSSLFRVGSDFVAIAFSVQSSEENPQPGGDTKPLSFQEVTPPTGAQQALLRLQDGVLFDISGYPIETAQVRGNNVFLIRDQTLYRIDLETLTATPMNNPSFDALESYHPMGWRAAHEAERLYRFLADGAGTVAIIKPGESTVLKLFYADNRPPVTGAPIDLPPDESALGSESRYALIYGADGAYHAFVRYYAGNCADPPMCTQTVAPGEYWRRYAFSGTGVTHTDALIGDNVADGTFINFENNAALESSSRFVVFSNGFYSLSLDASGTPAATWTAKALPATVATTLLSDRHLSGNFVYWRVASSVRRIELSAASVEEILVDEPGLLDYELIEGDLVYTKYITATNIGTFRIRAGETTATQIADSNMNVSQIVELEL